MYSFQIVSIILCHTLAIIAPVKYTCKNTHWKAVTVPVSNPTVCYLSLHCCAAFTVLVAISHVHNTIFSNICFVVWFSFTELFSLLAYCLKMRCQISILRSNDHSYLGGYLQNVKLQEIHWKRNAGSHISIQKGHLNLWGKIWRKKRKKGLATSWNNEIIK